MTRILAFLCCCLLGGSTLYSQDSAVGGTLKPAFIVVSGSADHGFLFQDSAAKVYVSLVTGKMDITGDSLSALKMIYTKMRESQEREIQAMKDLEDTRDRVVAFLNEGLKTDSVLLAMTERLKSTIDTVPHAHHVWHLEGKKNAGLGLPTWAVVGLVVIVGGVITFLISQKARKRI